MATMSSALDQVMEAASVALSRTDYLLCEQHCLEALAAARQAENWAYYAKILMPLQESRRQRRITAAEGAVRLGSTRLEGDPDTWLSEHPAACIVLTRPHDVRTAAALRAAATARHLNVEVLLADCGADEPRWTLRAFTGREVSCTLAAPPAPWRDRWLEGQADAGDATTGGATPADWFLDAAEALGDAAVAALTDHATTQQHLEGLEQCLEVVTDHEAIHHRLREVAHALARGEHAPDPSTG